MKNKLYRLLQKYCIASELELKSLIVNNRNTKIINDGMGNIFIDNNAQILAIAHRDTVNPRNKIPVASLIYSRDGNKIIGLKSIQLDDRLGVFIITELLPRMNINVDILITTDEEIGLSTAAQFIPNKSYNWFVEFDRHGILPVLYDYDSILNWYGAINKITDIDYGSFSDISSMTHLGICAVNWGTGYYSEHSNDCYMLDSALEIALKTFEEFYKKNKNKKYHFDVYRLDEKKYKYKSYYSSGYAAGYTDDIYKWNSAKKSAQESAKLLLSDNNDNTGIATTTSTTTTTTNTNPVNKNIKKKDDSLLPEYLKTSIDDIPCSLCGITFNLLDLNYRREFKGYLCSDCLSELELPYDTFSDNIPLT